MIGTLGIRMATRRDVSRITELGREYLLLGPYKEQITDNSEAIERFTEWLFQQEHARILVYQSEDMVQGVLAFIIYPHYYGGDLCANELIWCVDKAYRGQASMELLWNAEQMAYDMGAVYMQLTAPTPEVGKIYERCKYRLVECGYQAKLKDRVRCPQSVRV